MAWRRFLSASLALLLAGQGGPIQHARADSVPVRWVEYASGVTRQLQARLADDHDATAARLHAFLDARDASASVLRLWINRQGAISRVTFASLGDAQADRDLRQVVTRGGFGRPPPDMRQPLVLRLRLTFQS
jgi:hypothetical protein